MKMSLYESLESQQERESSAFENELRKLEIPVCTNFLKDSEVHPINFQEFSEELKTRDSEQIKTLFPNVYGASKNMPIKGGDINYNPAKNKRVAVLFSGGPAPGGHNVIAGLKKVLGNDNTLLGVRAGPKGLLEGNLFEITDKDMEAIVNTGGFDFLGSDRTKIKSLEQFSHVKKTCSDYNLDALVVIGGDDSNTNAAVLAESLYGNFQKGEGVSVIGVPKTIDGDMQVGDLVPISFGFDTATKIYSELVGNILKDTPSSRKYWHFAKLMGRNASHVTLEVALKTKPTMSFISEEIYQQKKSLSEIVNYMADVVIQRSKAGMNYGVVLIPEGIIEFIPEMNYLISELNENLAEFSKDNTFTSEERREFVYGKLSPENAKLMSTLPHYIENMLLAERDSHGNLPISSIPIEKLLIDMTKLKIKGIDSKVPFKTLNHFLGYEGRCGVPTRFDAAYTYNLGLTAGSLILANKTGYMAGVMNLDEGGQPVAVPLTGLLTNERRNGNDEVVIEKSLVELDSRAFKIYAANRETWALNDCFNSPGPIQLWGPTSNQMPITVALNRGYKSLDFKY